MLHPPCDQHKVSHTHQTDLSFCSISVRLAPSPSVLTSGLLPYIETTIYGPSLPLGGKVAVDPPG